MASASSSLPAIRDCWNSIGVRGDHSCEELAAHSHCRNCPAYSDAALALLEREVDAGSLKVGAGRFDRRDESDLGSTRSAIVFRIGGEWFALSTLVCDEVVAAGPVHSLPHRRSPVVLGLTSIRGELVVCLSLARLLGIGETPSEMRRLLVVRAEGGRIALTVDEVQHTHRYGEREVMPVPATMAGSAATYTAGVLAWQEKVVGCLREDALVAALERSLA